jgi:Cupin superfamily protein
VPGHIQEDQEKGYRMTVTGGTMTVPGISSEELAAMQDAAGAFRQQFAGGRITYQYTGPGPASSSHIHAERPADLFAVLGQGVPAGRVSSARDQAARLAGTLWEAVCFSGGTGTATHRYFPAALDPAWLAALPLPCGGAVPPGRPVALIDGTHRDFERHIEAATLRAAYGHRPRTRVHEDIGYGDDGWAGLAAAHLTRLSGCALAVLCSVYESAHGDESFGAHGDGWFAAVVQVAGAKDWRIGQGLLDGGGPGVKVTLAAGDILLLPKSLPHLVTTPADPGWSVHLAFAIDRDPPPGAGPGQQDQAAGRPGRRLDPFSRHLPCPRLCRHRRAGSSSRWPAGLPDVAACAHVRPRIAGTSRRGAQRT